MAAQTGLRALVNAGLMTSEPKSEEIVKAKETSAIEELLLAREVVHSFISRKNLPGCC